MTLLFCGEWAFLAQHGISNPDSTYVVQASGGSDRFDLVITQAEFRSNRGRQVCDSHRVANKIRVLRFERVEQGFESCGIYQLESFAFSFQLVRPLNEFVLEPFGDFLGLNLCTSDTPSAVNADPHSLQVNRFGQVVECPSLKADRRVRGIIHLGDHYYYQIGICFERLCNEFGTCHMR